MSGSLSNYAEEQIVRFLFTGLTVVRPTTRYAQLHSGPPGENGVGGVIGSLPRVALTFGAPVNNISLNNNDVTFVLPALLAATATHWTLWANSSGGNCLGWGTLKTSTHFGPFSTGLPGRDQDSDHPTTRVLPAGSLTILARGLPTYGGALALNWLFRSVTATRPTALWMALHRMPPNLLGVGGEFDLYGCARRPISFGDPVNGVTFNLAEVVFGPASLPWPQLSYYSIWDAVTGGNCLFTRATKEPYRVGAGGSLRFAIGDVKITAA